MRFALVFLAFSYTFAAWGGAVAPSTAPKDCADGGFGDRVSTDTELFWIDRSTDRILAVPRTGGASRVVVTNAAGACWLSVDGGHVYWTVPGAGEVRRAPTSGGAPVSTVASALRSPGALAVDGDRFFVICGDGARKGSVARGTTAAYASDAMASVMGGNESSGGTVHCDLCPVYCTRTVCNLQRCWTERYVCQWYSCNCRPGAGGG